ncbi:MAG: TIGR03663 family protein [Candidatus Marinimicrobia bacterium]|nr:TIGR03663 family protein [Candidatus Neomarinimicrobiota bacterium]
MPDRRIFTRLLVLSILAALVARLPNLTRRPMHTDEAVHAVKTAELLEGHAFVYDPLDYHGPTLYYAAWVSARLHGAGDLQSLQVRHLRLVTVIFGSGLIIWLLALFRHWHPLGLLASAALLAVSPSLVYYSRYYIMETLLLFFLLGLTVSIMRYLTEPSTRWMATGSACLGLMFATKETALLLAVAAGLGAALAIGTSPGRQELLMRLRAAIPRWHLPAAALISATVFATFISSFWASPENIGAYLSSFGSYVQRGLADQVHVQPWYYYGKLLIYSRWGDGPVWTDILTLALAILGAYGLIRDRSSSQAPVAAANHFLVWNTLAVMVLFSLIPYKTPWNILVMLGGMILLAGQGVVLLMQFASDSRRKIATGALLLGGLAHLGWQSAAATGAYEASPLNPYVYAHTSPDLERLVARLQHIAGSDPRGHELPIQVIASGHDYWPLPWDLRQFSHIAWWATIDTTATPADIIVVRSTAADRQSTKMDIANFIYRGFPPGQKHLYSYLFEQPVTLRPGVELSTLVRHDILDPSTADTEP